MGIRELEVTVLSARDLKNVKLLGGAMDPYCVAWVSPSSKVSGPVNKGGGVHPTWNAIIPLLVDDAVLEQGSDAALTVEIYSHGKFSNKLIGVASVPLSDVHSSSSSTAGKVGTGSSKAAAYPVRRKSGKTQGIINVAVKAGQALSDAEVAARSAPSMGVPAMASRGQFQQQQYPQQQQPYYPPQQQQFAPGQYSQAGYPPQQMMPQQQQQQPRRGGGFGGAGAGLGAGLLGGLLLGSALDSGGGGGGCGGGGCGGGCGG